MTRDARLTWRTVAGALPAVALIGTGSMLLSTGGAAAEDAAAQSKPVVTVPAAPLTRPAAPVLPPLPPVPDAALPSLPAGPTDVGGASSGTEIAPTLAAAGIPARALEAYKRAAALVGAADPSCGLDWPLVAAIGKVESDHGRYAGNGLDERGTVRPGIFGLPLNGSNNTAVIRDTDGGAFDRDTTWDRAVGPMQFIPGTWRTVGVDADGDGARDPQNMTDAATSTGVYLCSGPGDLTQPGDLRSAVLRYNHSDAYVAQVAAIAEGYRRGVAVLPSSDLTDAQRTASPYLPSGTVTSSPTTGAAAGTATPAPRSTAGTGKNPGQGGTSPAAGPGTSSRPGGSPPGVGTAVGPGSSPSPSSTTGLTDTVTGVVGGVVDGVTKPLQPKTTSPSPTSTSSTSGSSPSPTTRSALEPLKPVTNTLGQLVCPKGYELRLGIPPLCFPVKK